MQLRQVGFDNSSDGAEWHVARSCFSVHVSLGERLTYEAADAFCRGRSSALVELDGSETPEECIGNGSASIRTDRGSAPLCAGRWATACACQPQVQWLYHMLSERVDPLGCV